MNQNQNTSKAALYVCTAPPGGCGFRGRGWRKGTVPTRHSHDGTPLCQCGSQMEPARKANEIANAGGCGCLSGGAK